MRIAIEQFIAKEDWKQAAVSATNLGELLHSRGDLGEALQQARTSVEYADRSGDAFMRIHTRTTTLAAALHAMGLQDAAAAQFEEAGPMQKEMQPAYPLLYSLPGFRYCDLLLDQGRDAEVRGRAVQTLEWVKAYKLLISIALDHLCLGRAYLLSAQRGAVADLTPAAAHLDDSVDGLRRAGQQDYLPLGFLARAALRTHTRDFALARHDLDEALTLSQRCGLRLHEADAHLGLARLSLAEGAPAEAFTPLALARKIIAATGYHRRDADLAEITAALHGAGAGVVDDARRPT